MEDSCGRPMFRSGMMGLLIDDNVCGGRYQTAAIQGTFLNLLKPTGHVMHHQQFNIQQLPTLYLCVLYLSENRQRLVPLTA